jgi:predicted phosphodiesterase
MKIAILSDIKSNVYALEAVIADIKTKQVDAILNLGDSFYGPIEPKATYDLIRQNQFINLCGDEDRKILESSIAQLEENETLRYTYNSLGDDVLYWIQDLPFEKLIGADYYMIHGTYLDDSMYMLEDIASGKAKLRDDKKILEIIDDIKSTFVMCGNSCLPRCITLSSGQIVINPGAVGLQAFKSDLINKHVIENNTPDASYVILTVEDSTYAVEPIRVAYDYEKAALKAEENNRPDWAYSLRTGKVLNK